MFLFVRLLTHTVATHVFKTAKMLGYDAEIEQHSEELIDQIYAEWQLCFPYNRRLQFM